MLRLQSRSLCKQSNCGYTIASTKAIEAAKAVNSLLHLSSGDQESLLAVVEDYFTTPDQQTDDSDLDDYDPEVDFDAPEVDSNAEPGTHTHTHTHT